VSLLDGWRELAPQEQVETLLSLAGIFAHMHRQGIYHGDLNWRNILLCEKDGKRQFLLIDLDDCRYRTGYRDKLARRDLQHFFRDMQRAGVPEPLFLKFQHAWQKALED
jgi:tRNA A-37 threonylcarbamoyl transferase component Bud32